MTPGPHRNAQEQARAFAVAAHADQKYGERPYVWHLDAVAGIAAPYGEEAVVVAYLHDALEDTPVSRSEIEAAFGPKIAARVALLTDEPGANRRERKARAHSKLAGAGGDEALALIVKVADRLANVRVCVADRNHGLWKMYRSEHAAFRSAAFRAGQCDGLWSELDRLFDESGFEAGASDRT